MSKMKAMRPINKNTLPCFLILFLVVPPSIFCQNSPSPLPLTTTGHSPTPPAIPNPLELLKPISSELFARLKKANPFQDQQTVYKQRPDLVPLAAAISEVQQALEKYQQLQGKNDLNLESAEFSFKATQTTVVGANLSWWIITIGGELQDQDVKEVSFTYSVPKPTEISKRVSLMAEKTSRLEEDLVPTLQQAALAAQNDFTWGGKNFTKKITVSLQYGVQVKLEGEAKIPVYTLLVGPKASWSKNSVQSIKLTFGK